jgi:ArsR family transcriptional regulator
MKKTEIVAALAALAQDSRLDMFRLLVQAGPKGLGAGEIAARLAIAASNLTFHADRLRHAGLITVRRDGRHMIYAARYESMRTLVAYLSENCCKGVDPSGASCAKPSTRKRVKEPA